MRRTTSLKCLLAFSLSINAMAEELPGIQVETHIFKPDTTEQLSPSVTVLDRDTIERNLATTLGETLKNLPGISSTHFTVGSSRPIIRGLGANRVQILENGVDTADVSSLSDDHAVTTDGYAAEQIEIIRGPATLRYGPSASGGVINVINKRLAKTITPFSLNAISEYDSTTNGEMLGVDTNGNYGSFTWHLDALKRTTEDTEIKGYADIDGRENKGKIHNTHVDKKVFGLGVAYIIPEFRAAFAFTKNDNDYGLPSKYEEDHDEDHDEGHEDEHDEHSDLTIDMEQERYTFEVEFLKQNPYLKSVLFNSTYTDYEHKEKLADGDVSINFDNEEWENRLELRSQTIKHWTYAVGLQNNARELSAIGEKSLLQPVDMDRLGIFSIVQHSGQYLDIELGARFDDLRYSSDLGDKNFNSYSTSAGASWTFKPGLKAHALLVHSERPPQELALYGYGEHHASGTFEQGSLTLDKEVSKNIELGISQVFEDRSWAFTSYFNQIDDYIYAASQDSNHDGIADRVEHDGTLDPDGELLSVRYNNRDAQFYGFEAHYNQNLTLSDGSQLNMNLYADYVRAKFTESGTENVPRITPPSIGANFTLPHGMWLAQVNLRHAFKQNKNGSLETKTDSYNQFNFMVSREITLKEGAIETYFKVNNLFNTKPRQHSSFSKEYAPLAGRSLQLGLMFKY